MKKILLSAVALLSLTAVNAQNKITGETVATWDRIEMQDDRSEDTLVTANFASNCGTGYGLVGSANGGYVVGTNGYGDVGKGQFYSLAGSASVVGAYVWYGAKKSVDGTSSFVATILDVNKAIIGTSNTKTLADIDTTAAGASGWTEYTFATPVAVTGDFYAFVSVDGMDTVGIVSTVSPCGGDAYEIWNDATFIAINDAGAWGATSTIDLGILPLVNNLGFTGLFDSEAAEFGVYTNDNSLVLNAISDDVIVNVVTIFDMNGKAVKTISVTDQFETYTFDISDIITGTYIVSLNTNKGTLGQKINIK